MSSRTFRLRSSLLALAVGGLFFSATRLLAQELVLSGVVLGPSGDPVAEQAVLLHRVTQAGGDLLARATTDTAGRFTIRTAADAGSQGIYFVATRYDGQLYIGPMRRAPFAPGDEYIVQVGVPGVGDISGLSAAANSPPVGLPATPAAARPAETPGRGFGFALLLTALAVGAYLSIRGTGPSRRRRALIRIAELDERNTRGLTVEQTRARKELLRQATEPPR